MGNQSASGITRIYNAFLFSMKGFKAAWQHEEAFRQEVLLFIVTTPLAIWLGGNHIEKLLLIGSVALILMLELINSAVEAVVDRIGPECHELSGRAKDLGSATVFLAIVWAAITWIVILFG